MAYKVLLADDSITIQKVVELILSEEDAEVISASDGLEALESLERIRPDVVLADVEMPKMGGYEICRKIKENPNTSHIPVILLAGAFESFDESRAKTVEAEDFIIKPFDSQDLLEKINRARGAAASDVSGLDSAGQAAEMEAASFSEQTPLESEAADAAAASLGGVEEPASNSFSGKSDEVVSSGDEFDDEEDFWEAEEVQISDMLGDDPVQAAAPAGEVFSTGAGFNESAGESEVGPGPLGVIKPETDAAAEAALDEPVEAETAAHEEPAFQDPFKNSSESVADDSAGGPAAGISEVAPPAAAQAGATEIGRENMAGELREPGSGSVSGAVMLPEISREDMVEALQEAVSRSVNIPGTESDEILLGILREKISEVIPGREQMLDMSKTLLSTAVPARADMQEMISASLRMDEIGQEAREAAMEAIEKNLTPVFKGMVEEVLWEIIPGIAEKAIEQVLKETMVRDLKEAIISVARDTIPRVAEDLIGKEIERLRSTE